MSGDSTELTLDDVYEVLNTWTGIPVERLDLRVESNADVEDLQERLASHIFGQEHAIEAVCRELRRRMSIDPRLRDPGPLGVFLLAGSSGVGKTEFARQLAEYFYGGAERYLKKIDMSEFTAEHTSARLVGAPPGYVGYGAGGQLTDALKQDRHGVLLLDEIEKAHPSILTRDLLPLIGEGLVHDMSTGQVIDARHYLVFLTSNVGTNLHLEGRTTDLNRSTATSYENQIHRAVRASLPHEFLGRIDQVIVFRRLGDDAVVRIWQKKLVEFETKLSRQYGRVVVDVDVQVQDSLLDSVSNRIEEEGARAVHKAFRKLENPVLDVLDVAGSPHGDWRVGVRRLPDGSVECALRAADSTDSGHIDRTQNSDITADA